MNVSVRPVRASDAQSIVDLLNPIIRAGRFTILDNPITLKEQIEFISALPDRSVFHVAISRENGSLVGMQDIVPIFPRIGTFRHVCEIATYVALQARRLGIGTALFQATVQAARNAEFTKIVATIRADNADAVRYYKAQGFEVIGVAKSHALVGGRLLDEVLAERLIS